MRLPKLCVVRCPLDEAKPLEYWMISGYRVNGKRKRLFFKDQALALRRLKELERRQRQEGTLARHLPEELRIMAVKCTDQLKPYGKSLQDATNHYLRYLADSQKPNCTVAELVANFLAHEANLNRSVRHQADLRNRLERFAADFGARTAREVTQHEVRDWIGKLKGLGPRSRYNFRARLAIVFQYGIRHDFCDKNPAHGIELEKLRSLPPEIFTPEQLRAVLTAATPELLPLLAIGAFSGLRTAELLRLEWEDCTRGHVRVEAAKAKTASRRVIRMSENLAAWLAPYAGRIGKLWGYSGAAYYWNVDQTLKRTGLTLKWPKNGLRHSYASYHLAKFEDAAELAHRLGHTNSRMLYDHYREVVSSEDAERYWAIFPPTPAQNIVPMLEASGI
jgi:integrase